MNEPKNKQRTKRKLIKIVEIRTIEFTWILYLNCCVFKQINSEFCVCFEIQVVWQHWIHIQSAKLTKTHNSENPSFRLCLLVRLFKSIFIEIQSCRVRSLTSSIFSQIQRKRKKKNRKKSYCTNLDLFRWCAVRQIYEEKINL